MNNQYQLCIADDSTHAAWNEYLATKPLSTASSSFEWQPILSDAYQCDHRYFYVKDSNDKIVGVLSTYLTKNLKNQIQLFSTRHGLVADNSEAAQHLLSAAQQFAQKTSAIKAEISSGTLPFETNFTRTEKCTVQLDLSIPKEALWKNMRDKTRNAVRKGEKANLTIKQGHQLLGDFYPLYANRMASKGVNLLSFSFFQSLLQHFGYQCKIYIAYFNNLPIATMLVIYFGHSAIYAYGGMRAGYEKYCANHTLLWKIINDCYTQKITLLDLGESSPNSGVYKFKTWFGGTPRAVYYYNLLPDTPYIDQVSLLGKLRESIYFRAVHVSPQRLKKRLLTKLRRHQRII